MKPFSMEFLELRRSTILADLQIKLEAGDWHGVQDCASDIREVEAMMRLLSAREREPVKS